MANKGYDNPEYLVTREYQIAAATTSAGTSAKFFTSCAINVGKIYATVQTAGTAAAAFIFSWINGTTTSILGTTASTLGTGTAGWQVSVTPVAASVAVPAGSYIYAVKGAEATNVTVISYTYTPQPAVDTNP